MCILFLVRFFIFNQTNHCHANLIWFLQTKVKFFDEHARLVFPKLNIIHTRYYNTHLHTHTYIHSYWNAKLRTKASCLSDQKHTHEQIHTFHILKCIKVKCDMWHTFLCSLHSLHFLACFTKPILSESICVSVYVTYINSCIGWLMFNECSTNWCWWNSLSVFCSLHSSVRLSNCWTIHPSIHLSYSRSLSLSHSL